MMNKPQYHCKEAMLVGDRMFCKVVDHPEFDADMQVCTSRIVSIVENVVETQNTIYHVDNWGN